MIDVWENVLILDMKLALEQFVGKDYGILSFRISMKPIDSPSPKASSEIFSVSKHHCLNFTFGISLRTQGIDRSGIRPYHPNIEIRRDHLGQCQVNIRQIYEFTSSDPDKYSEDFDFFLEICESKIGEHCTDISKAYPRCGHKC